MAKLMYRCPRTGVSVDIWLADEVTPVNADTHTSAAILSRCGQLRFRRSIHHQPGGPVSANLYRANQSGLSSTMPTLTRRGNNAVGGAKRCPKSQRSITTMTKARTSLQ